MSLQKYLRKRHIVHLCLPAVKYEQNAYQLISLRYTSEILHYEYVGQLKDVDKLQCYFFSVCSSYTASQDTRRLRKYSILNTAIIHNGIVSF